MIRIYAFHNDTTGATTASAANEAWYNQELEQVESVFNVDASIPENTSFINQFQITTYPTVIFVELTSGSQGRTISRIEGAATASQIYNELLNAIILTGTESGEGENIEVITGDGGESGLGLGLDLFNWGLPAWLWLIGGIWAYNKIKN